METIVFVCLLCMIAMMYLACGVALVTVCSILWGKPPRRDYGLACITGLLWPLSIVLILTHWDEFEDRFGPWSNP